MASGFFGADVEQLRQLSRSLAQHAEELQSIRARLGSRVEAVSWLGPDADRFRGDWNERLAVSLSAAARALNEASNQAETNARQQEQASGSAAGSPSLPPIIGSNGPFPLPSDPPTMPIRRTAEVRISPEEFGDILHVEGSLDNG